MLDLFLCMLGRIIDNYLIRKTRYRVQKHGMWLWTTLPGDLCSDITIHHVRRARETSPTSFTPYSLVIAEEISIIEGE